MNGFALLGILLLIYALAILGLTIKKPENIWSMPKIKWFNKMLGSKGTDILFYIIAGVAACAGIWLLLT